MCNQFSTDKKDKNRKRGAVRDQLSTDKKRQKLMKKKTEKEKRRSSAQSIATIHCNKFHNRPSWHRKIRKENLHKKTKRQTDKKTKEFKKQNDKQTKN